MKTPPRYVDAKSYDKGSARYHKSLSMWRNFEVSGGLAAAAGAGFAWGAISSYPNLNEQIIFIATIVFGGAAVLGALAWALGKYMIRHHKLDNFVHRLAVHFMSEMGIENPEKIIARNPRYLEAFEEIRSAVTAKEAENNGVGIRSQSLTPLSRRIGSLVLRDDKSLASCPRLLSLIEDRGILDYDNLATLLDSMNDLPPSIAEGAL